jgi:hypothetical protein
MRHQYQPLPNRQRGAVAVVVGLTIFVLVGMIGLALDSGQLFVNKTELQNAADACALAAARELDGNGDALVRADAAGVLVGTQNLVGFQNTAVTLTAANITYSEYLSPNADYQTNPDPDGPSELATKAKFAMCTVARSDIGMWFMGVRGFDDQTVRAYAVATLAPSQTTCAIPVGLCKQEEGTSEDPYAGFVVGQWYDGKFEAGGSGGGGGCVSPSGSLGTSGNFNWIDFSPPNGGGDELKDILTGVGQCELPPVGTLVGQSGTNNGLKAAWNTRFGIYSGSYNASNAPPDFTGIAFTNPYYPQGQDSDTWPTSSAAALPNAYSGSPYTGSTSNYETAAAARLPYQDANPSGVDGNPTVLPQSPPDDGASYMGSGSKRRLVVTPIVDCESLCTTGTTTVPIIGYGCVLMLSPMPNNPDQIYLEYRGAANEANSGCASFGLAGGSSGPLVPVLVQ